MSTRRPLMVTDQEREELRRLARHPSMRQALATRCKVILLDERGMTYAAIANLIRENKTFRIDSAIQTGRKFGMQLLDDHLWTLYQKGLIAADEMIDKGKDPGELTEKVHRSGGSVGRTELDTAE